MAYCCPNPWLVGLLQRVAMVEVCCCYELFTLLAREEVTISSWYWFWEHGQVICG